MLKKQYECPHFRILVIGRANAGKTTILEKVCGVAQGTNPVIYDEHGAILKANIKPKSELKHEPILHESSLKPGFKMATKMLFNRKPVPSATHLTPSMQVSCMVAWIYH
jgi:GTPase SAR1 family protein